MRNKENLVDDPVASSSFPALADEREGGNLSALFSEDYVEFYPLLRLMFPAHAQDRLGISDLSDNRVFKRRNLNRLLYLGDPPRTMRRHSIESLWSSPALDLLELKLKEHIDTGMISYILDRLDDLLPSLPASGDFGFWLSLSRALSFQDAKEAVSSRPSIARHAAETLNHFMAKTADKKMRHVNLLQHLSENGDMIFVPRIVRTSLFAHGLTIHDDVPRRDSLFGKKEAERLRDSEVTRCTDLLFEGALLAQAPTLEAVYLILNADLWTDDHREHLTQQLWNRDSLLRFASLLVPPSTLIGKDTLEKMVDTSQ